VEVRRIEAAEWRELRELRLRALADAPDAFASTLEREAAFPEDVWRERAEGGPASATFIARALIGHAVRWSREHQARELVAWVAEDPRPCVGDAAVDAVDWVFWAVDDPGAWEPRSRELAVALGLDHERLWAWCAAFAAMLAAAEAARGASAEQVAALLALSP
jgi:hypothetical protein